MFIFLLESFILVYNSFIVDYITVHVEGRRFYSRLHWSRRKLFGFFVTWSLILKHQSNWHVQIWTNQCTQFLRSLHCKYLQPNYSHWLYYVCHCNCDMIIICNDNTWQSMIEMRTTIEWVTADLVTFKEQWQT